MYLFSKQFCLGKFKSGQNHLQVLKGDNNTGQNNPVYSICCVKIMTKQAKIYV